MTVAAAAAAAVLPNQLVMRNPEDVYFARINRVVLLRVKPTEASVLSLHAG